MDEANVSIRISAKKAYQRLGFGLLIIAASTIALQLLIYFFAGIAAKRGFDPSAYAWFPWVASFVPLYLVGIPCGLLFLRKAPTVQSDKCKMGGKNFSNS